MNYCSGDCAFLVKTTMDRPDCKGEFWYCGSLDLIINCYTSNDGLMPGQKCNGERYLRKLE